MIEFFLPIIPPTVTAQEHQVRVVDGRPVFYDPPALKAARAKLMAWLAHAATQHRGDWPQLPLKRALRLTVKWCFPAGDSHSDGEYRITKPDTDNLNKLLKDCMTRAGYWKDDALVASEIIEKFWAKVPGIYIRVEALE